MILNISMINYHQKPPHMTEWQDTPSWYYLEAISEDVGYLCGHTFIDIAECQELIEQAHLICLLVATGMSFKAEDGVSVEEIIQKIRLKSSVPILLTYDHTYRTICGTIDKQVYLRLSEILNGEKIYLVCGQHQETISLIGPSVFIPSVSRVYDVPAAKRNIMQYEKIQRYYIYLPYLDISNNGLLEGELASALSSKLKIPIIIHNLRAQYPTVYYKCHWNMIFMEGMLNTKHLLLFLRRAIACINIPYLAGLGRMFVEAAIARAPVVHSGVTEIGKYLYPNIAFSPYTDFDEMLANTLEIIQNPGVFVEYAYQKVDDLSPEGIRNSLKKQLNLSYF